METVTFLRENVQEYIINNFVPLKYNSGNDAEQFRRFDVRMTPTYVVLDAEGNETGRVIGYQAPDEFIDQIDGLGKY
jgi:thioredoxin-related protein